MTKIVWPPRDGEAVVFSSRAGRPSTKSDNYSTSVKLMAAEEVSKGLRDRAFHALNHDYHDTPAMLAVMLEAADTIDWLLSVVRDGKC